jgi:4-amino-4-deoxy-L-arabinose transferase-like glycosyltransferase
MQQYFKKIRSAFAQNAILNKKILWMAIVLFVIALLKIFILSHYELHSEEAQYWLWSKRLQLSYYSKPPLIAYLNWFSTSILGDTVFAIRINAVIFGVLVSVISYLFAFELFRNQSTAIFAAIVTNVFPLILSNSIFF